VVRKDIVNHLKNDRECFSTTMVDYYALPGDGDGAWPGRQAASMLPFKEKAARVESSVFEDVCRELETAHYNCRFLPYIVIHEFEGLLFSDCQMLAAAIGRPDLGPRFQAIRDKFPNPEEINDSPTTAPSKRVLDILPSYQKPIMGTLAAIGIGLQTIRTQCPHFGEWLDRLESL
jgi:hypothetical protein